MQENNKDGKGVFIYILLFGVIVSILISFYSFYYRKNYDFYIEMNCDKETEMCFYRDCESNPDNCPPNNLSYYSQYVVKARDFDRYCENEDCTNVCTNGVIKCEKIECTEEDISNGICTLPTTEEENDLLID